MKLVIFTMDFPPRVGGVETVAFQLAEHIGRIGHEVLVIAPDSQEATSYDAGQTQTSFAMHRITLGPDRNMLEQFRQKSRLERDLGRAVFDFMPDAVLCLSWDPCAYVTESLLRARLPRIPYYVIAHGMELLRLPTNPIKRMIKARMRARALSGARRIFAVSHFTREQVISLGVDPTGVVVIPNGVNMESTQIGEESASAHGQRLLTIARLVPRKGHDTMLAALPQVLARFPNATYDIAGIGPERKRLEGLVQKYGLQGHVRFLGLVDNETKQKLLRECAVFVLPCRQMATDFEGFGISFLEAMRYSKAVVGGRSGGVPEVVTDGESGLLVTPNEPGELADAISGILANPDLARQLGAKARCAVATRFQWRQIAQQYAANMEFA